MTEYLVTDFLNEKEYDKKLKKKYLELPNFDKNFNYSKDIIFYKNWKNHKNKITDMKKIFKCIIIF